MASGLLLGSSSSSSSNQNLHATLLLFIVLCSTSITWAASSMVILRSESVSRSFEDMGADFAPVNPSGECGELYLADPLDACSPLRNKVKPPGNSSSTPFVLIIRGGCGFEDKVRLAQNAGFKAAIVYDHEDSGNLITMAGNSAGIDIPAVFISKPSGEHLRNYAGLDNVELWLIPSLDNATFSWSIVAIFFIFLFAIAAVLAVCFFVRKHDIARRHQMPQPRRLPEFHGMSSKLVKAMPSLVFTTVLEDNCTSATCAICLEDYNVGDKIRILPCKHKFHAVCVDCWLTGWRTFCPVCKQDAGTSTATATAPPASESTPLLSPIPSSSSPLSSERSSSVIRIIASASPAASSSYVNHSVSTSPRIPLSVLPHQHRTPPMMRSSWSSMDVQNLSAYGSFAHTNGLLHFSSSFRYPSISPQTSSHYLLPPSPWARGSVHATSPYLGGHYPNPLHYPCLSPPYVSAQSLPGC